MFLLKQKSLGTIIAWCIYDWASSAYYAVIITFIFAAYFNQKIAINTIVGTHQWGNALGISGIIIAVFSPIFGAIADNGAYRKRWLFIFAYLGIISASLLWFAYPSHHYIIYTLSLIILCTTSLELSGVFYNALLPSVAPKRYLGRISGWAWGLGYAGGLTCLSIALFAFVYHPPSWLDTTSYAQIRICGPLIGLWLLIFSIPLFLFVPDAPANKLPAREAIKAGFKQLANTLHHLPKQKNLVIFLIAQMIYIDGLNTLFSFGGIYAAGTFGMSLTEVLEFGIIINVMGGIGAGLLAWIDDWIGAKKTILISLIGLITFGIGILTIHSKQLFWVLAPFIGLFVGPVQASSRSLMARLAKPAQISEMFGLYSLSGKATSFIGPFLLGEVTLIFASQRAGMATIFIFFIIGGFLLLRVRE